MTAFLASIEGGIFEDTTFESKLADSSENARKGALGAKVSNLLSQFVSAEASGELANKVSETLEAHYKSTIRIPSAALFIRLRKLLLEQEEVKLISKLEQLSDVKIGDLVEVSGLATPNPAYEIRRAFNQLIPLLEPIANMQIAELEQLSLSLNTATAGGDKSIKMKDQEISLRNNQDIKSARSLLSAAQDQLRAQSSMYKTMGDMLSTMFTGNSMETVIFKSDQFQSICRIYPALVRDERPQDIYNAQWSYFGKVIGMLTADKQYDLLQGSPIGYFAKDQFPKLAAGLNNENLNIQTVQPVIQGPGFIIATMAIFA